MNNSVKDPFQIHGPDISDVQGDVQEIPQPEPLDPERFGVEKGPVCVEQQTNWAFFFCKNCDENDGFKQGQFDNTYTCLSCNFEDYGNNLRKPRPIKARRLEQPRPSHEEVWLRACLTSWTRAQSKGAKVEDMAGDADKILKAFKERFDE